MRRLLRILVGGREEKERRRGCLNLFSSSLLLPCSCSAFEKRREEIYGMQRIQRQAAGLTVDATNASGFVLPCTPAKAQTPTTADPPHCSLQCNAVNFSRFSTALLFFASRQKEVINPPTGKHPKNKIDKYPSTDRKDIMPDRVSSGGSGDIHENGCFRSFLPYLVGKSVSDNQSLQPQRLVHHFLYLPAYV